MRQTPHQSHGPSRDYRENHEAIDVDVPVDSSEPIASLESQPYTTDERHSRGLEGGDWRIPRTEKNDCEARPHRRDIFSSSGPAPEIFPLLIILGAGVTGALSFMGHKLATDSSIRRGRSLEAPVLFGRKH
ncbi:hypothetical protein K493DRAFT_355432 [Basidiobolus meristosporus CBS 931.73]|uniref:Uncharacterized protein n=1 Tax=Basidiobolus meristosporus CBS 931.73 TaxID=1314790 RepID=A0A1Y1Y0P5_9FUNG|nr:hypothetical protein K493DRAFT_355432 [Basidiobolus meristosporus CBS 931.73]|eukprot:ORX91581.1 hypothetical protein K493DRAFT_355432 [Basidiobolus meristosporus CBS 931.73]